MEQNFFLKATPSVESWVYELLPDFLKELTDQFTDIREKDVVLLSTLTILSGCFSGIRGKYRTDWVGPNLYSFIVAPPANAKGVMKYSQKLGMPIQDLLQKINSEKRVKYQSELSQWNKTNKKAKETVSPAPKKPKYPVLFLPGNSSAAAIYKLLEDSHGIGIISESEADTLSGAIKQDWGNFSHLLRGAFHHERLTMSRSGDDLYLQVEQPFLSVLLTGTPDQVSRLIGSTEDGLCSRFLFYCYSREIKWIDPTPCMECSDLNEYFEFHGHEILRIKTLLDKGGHTFKLTNQQFSSLSQNFASKLSSVSTINYM